jgi:hypothetical protein
MRVYMMNILAKNREVVCRAVSDEPIAFGQGFEVSEELGQELLRSPSWGLEAPEIEQPARKSRRRKETS